VADHVDDRAGQLERIIVACFQVRRSPRRLAKR
jgi:hypothetical protein